MYDETSTQKLIESRTALYLVMIIERARLLISRLYTLVLPIMFIAECTIVIDI